ncbi:MAG: hypothetical protein J7L17_04510, partial [Thaumarchaeota archaeon]|nr:hypothetical protein [Nitrososphaerota archaeon]
MGILEAIKGGIGRIAKSRLSRVFGKVLGYEVAGMAVGTGMEIASMFFAEATLHQAIADMGKALQELDKAIQDNQDVLHGIRTAYLKNFVVGSFLGRLSSRIGSILRVRRWLGWFTAYIVFMEFSMLATELYQTIYKYVLARMQRFAMVPLGEFGENMDVDLDFGRLRALHRLDPRSMAVHALREFLDLQHDLNLIASFFDTVGSNSALGQWLGFRSVARMVTNISWSLGIGWLSWIAIGPGMRFSIARGLEKFYRRELRPEDFTREMVQRFLRRGIVDEEEAKEYLRDLGWEEDKIVRIILDSWDYPSRTELQDLYEDKIITDDKLSEWFETLGIHPGIREDMLILTKKRATSSVLKSYISAVESNYLKGYRSYEFLKNAYNLTISNINVDDLRALTIAEKDFGERNDERVKTLVEAFRDGTIDEEAFRAQLSEIIVRPEVLENLVALEKQRKQPKIRVEPSETLERRLRRLENRLEILQIQYRYQSKLREQDLAVMDARISRVKTRYDAEIERIRRLAEIRAEAILEEANISAGYDVERAEARIRELTAVTEAQISRLQTELEAIIKALEEEFETFRVATTYEVQARIRYWQTKLETASPDQRPIIEAKIQLLQELAALSVVEREQRVRTVIERYRARYNARIEELKERLEARIAFLRETAGL